MLRNQHQSSKTGVRAAVAFALLAVVGLGWTSSAQAQTQCSGSIILSPDKGQNPPDDVLESGEALSIGVAIFNTTTVGGAPAVASVRNTTTIILSCATEFPCVSELNALTFVSCTPQAGVTCIVDPMNANHVLLTYDGNAKALAAAGVTDLATINVTATPGQHIVNPASGQFFVVGETGAGNIFNANCAGSGQGSAPLFYPGLCGDGFTDPELGEECDDGNDTPFDGCGIPGGGANNCLLCPDSTPCPDTDGNECSAAGCNASGLCDQLHTLPNSTPCTDTGNECAAAGCNGAGQCDQLHVPVQPSTPCTDVDGNVCTEAGCNDAGVCDQNHVLPDSTPCEDDGTECAAAGCNGAGVCDQLHTPDPPSGPCTDNDGNVCTEAGCNGAGVCDQLHVLPDSTPCEDTANECAIAGCNGAGVCDQLHVPAQDSTPCADTDNNTCTEAGCLLGVCEQRHVLPDSKPCPDVTNECATAGCDGTGFCDQNHANVPDDTPCTDSDGTQCTDPACLNGECDQDQGGVVTCQDPVCTSCDPVDGICKLIEPLPGQCISELHHYQCYELDRFSFPGVAGLNLFDRFGDSTGDIRRAKRLCLPASKNGEDPQAPLDRTHLTGYELKQTTPRFTLVNDLPVTNQFGTIDVDLVRAEMLMVPTAKSLDAPPDPLSNGIDHFKCYRVVRARQRVAGIEIEDQFGSLTVNIKRPSRLCVAVNKNQEGVSDLNTALMCYQVRQATKPRFSGRDPLFLNNQFGHDTPLAVTRPTELCVPSTLEGGDDS